METTTPPRSHPHLPRRITVARGKSKLSQAELAKRLGFKDRQTLTAIEAGQRRVSAEELVILAEATGHDLDFFTDPYRLVGEGAFSYRAADIVEDDLNIFEERVGNWLALWRQLGESRGESASLLRPRLVINDSSTFEEAQAAGEAVGRELRLGYIPAGNLVAALERDFNLLVLKADMPKGVSGAAVQLATGDAILINRAEPPGRKNFDLSHELFHVLTWDALPPERVDRMNPTGYKQKRTEQLADNFAGALLMPTTELKPRWEKLMTQSSLKNTLASLAEHFQVSVPAVGWRVVALGWLKADELASTVARSPFKSPQAVHSPLFSQRYIERMAWGIDQGEISVKRLLGLLQMGLDDFRACCQAYRVKVDIGL